MNKKTKTNYQLVILGICMSAGIFLLDLSIPLGVAGGVPYVAVVLLSLWSPLEGFSLIAATTGTILTLLGFFFSPSGGIMWVVIFNRSLAIFAIWVTAILIFFYKRVEEELKTHHDYLDDLVKERTRELTSIIKKHGLEKTKRILVEDNLLEQIQRNKLMLDISMDGFFIADTRGKIIELNKSFANILGYSGQELKGMTISDFEFKETPKEVEKHIGRLLKLGQERFETKHRRKGGTFIDVEISTKKIEMGEKSYFFSFARDITERKKAEQEKENMQAQLFHSEKLKVVGQLAGGIAHEFNNILMALMGYSETIIKEMKKNDPLKKKVNNILFLTNRASDFTRSLLAFSRKSAIYPKIVNLNEIVKRVNKLLSNLLDEEIEIITKLSRKDLFIKVDIDQVEQVLMNLATNARDAMHGSGRIFIKTGLKEINEKYIKKQGYGKCGKYAILTFTDTGSGMDKETLKKVFEPFFTTKDVEQGTGLGLSTVYGIIEQHDGFIDVESELGKGTTFKMYFPLTTKDVKERDRKKIIPLPGGGMETILVAEDNKDIREMIKEELEKFGYSVIVAVDGKDAVKKFKKKKKDIQLVLLDIVMPQKRGTKAYEEIVKEKPEVKSIFMTGYSEEVFDDIEIVSENVDCIFKPISIFQLIKTVRDTLDKTVSSGTPLNTPS